MFLLHCIAYHCIMHINITKSEIIIVLVATAIRYLETQVKFPQMVELHLEHL